MLGCSEETKKVFHRQKTALEIIELSLKMIKNLVISRG